MEGSNEVRGGIMARLRVGVLGLNHDHVWGNLAALNDNELGQAVAAADPDPRLRERLAREHGGVEALASYDALLERADLDAVLIFADNRASAELGVRALGRGLPVMIEKPMAADLAGADAVLTAARKAGLPLMVNWPTVWRPALRHGLALVRSGAVGEPVQLSHRGGHAGPREYGCSPQFCEWLYDPTRNGGGALVDYCGYGAILCRTVLGRPDAVTAVARHLRKEGLPAEDNAVVILRYPRALGLLEASWTQIGAEPALAMVVFGNAGTLLVHQPKATREGEKAGAGRIQLVTPGGSEWIDPPALPADERDGPSYFLSRIAAGRAVEGLCAPEVGRDAQEILAAALRSSASGREVTLPLTAS
ncbi:MAG: gfo/Idh/MocA family oxidoreductase [Candidatus Rokuibacteriota bacterium]|nr:MAG: gfo/Idh/MocA family oxidoreductase [Candidatus Rokubacteria bacterium]